MTSSKRPGADAIMSKGWFKANQWLLLRRISQLSILALFVAGPWAGIWLVKGNLNASLTLNILPLTDPYVLIQTLLTRHWPEMTAITGALVVLVFYLLVGGRMYCSWVCPVNMVTDAAHWLRERLGIKGGAQLSRNTRYWILGMTLVLAAMTGTVAWEMVNPVSMLHRGLIFGMGLAWTIILAVFILDLLVSKRAWCGHLCPVGAFYNLLGHVTPLRISAVAREQCNDCADCYAICPEPQIIPATLKGADKGIGPVIMSANCTNCGRCIDICAKDVFVFDLRFHHKTSSLQNEPLPHKTEVLS